MGQKFYDESDIRAIATAIRSRNGSQNTYTVSQMHAAIATQDNTTLYALIDRSITSIESSGVTSIGPYAFCSCTSLTSVSLPNATSIKGYAFNGCAELASVSLPNATRIEGHAFSYSPQLTSVILGKRATLLSSNAFNNANNAIIYVQPEDLTWYSTATNWSALYTSGRIKSIEELPT